MPTALFQFSNNKTLREKSIYLGIFLDKTSSQTHIYSWTLKLIGGSRTLPGIKTTPFLFGYRDFLWGRAVLLALLLGIMVSETLKSVGGVVVHTCNPRTQETEAGGSWVQGQPQLHSKSGNNLGYIGRSYSKETNKTNLQIQVWKFSKPLGT
jgi:hypothetical protein